MHLDEGLDFQPDFAKLNGLMPVVVQDVQSQEVLMLAYANQEALSLTQKTGLAHYYSRSRDQLWQKGESSGHTQKICEIRIDCDQDTLLYLVEQQGPACHTGRQISEMRSITILIRKSIKKNHFLSKDSPMGKFIPEKKISLSKKIKINNR